MHRNHKNSQKYYFDFWLLQATKRAGHHKTCCCASYYCYCCTKKPLLYQEFTLSVRLSVVLCQTLVSWKSSQKAINRKMTTFWWFFKKLSKEIFYRGLYHFSTIKCTYLNSSLSLGIFFTKIQLRPTLSPLFQSLRFIGPNFVQG